MSKILVADDDDILLDLVSFRLEAEGHEIISARDGVEALNMVREHSPDLVILDAMMPVINGAEVLREIREDAELADLPVMMLTARKGDDDVVASLRAGASDYMTKPFMPQELAVRVEMLLRRSHAQRRAG